MYYFINKKNKLFEDKLNKLDLNKLSLKQRDHLGIRYVSFFKQDKKTFFEELKNIPVRYIW